MIAAMPIEAAVCALRATDLEVAGLRLVQRRRVWAALQTLHGSRLACRAGGVERAAAAGKSRLRPPPQPAASSSDPLWDTHLLDGCRHVFLDVGAKDKKEVEKMGIHVGCVVTYEDTFMVLNKDWYVARALDNRAGGFMIAEVARLLHEEGTKLPFGLYITNSVQEEIGLRGAQMIAERISPDVAIVTDVTHCTHTPMMNKIDNGDVAAGKGPGVTYGPAVQNNLLQRIIDTADAEKIPLQRMAASRFTGTDTDAFAYSNKGVASALISLPLRYMHTTVEMVHRDDVENCIKLILATLKNIQPGEDFKYIR